MGFYLVRALWPALLIDIGLTIILFKKRRKVFSALLGGMAYPVGTIFWSVVLVLSEEAFRGQGILGLYLLIAVGIALSLVRIILGLLVLVVANIFNN